MLTCWTRLALSKVGTIVAGTDASNIHYYVEFRAAAAAFDRMRAIWLNAMYESKTPSASRVRQEQRLPVDDPRLVEAGECQLCRAAAAEIAAEVFLRRGGAGRDDVWKSRMMCSRCLDLVKRRLVRPLGAAGSAMTGFYPKLEVLTQY